MASHTSHATLRFSCVSGSDLGSVPEGKLAAIDTQMEQLAEERSVLLHRWHRFALPSADEYRGHQRQWPLSMRPS